MSERTTEIMQAIILERYNPNDEYLGTEKPVNRKKPFVSVLMATYNHEPYIAEAIDSVIRQKTGFDFELLIGEDESSDDTRTICKTYAEKYPDIIRLFLRDRSLSHLYDNSGNTIQLFNMRWLRMSARAEYFAVCEGDDYWCDANKLEKQVREMEKFPECTMSFHPAKIKDMRQPDAGIVTKKHKEKIHLFSVEDIIRGGGSFCPSASLMFRKKALITFDRVTENLILPVGDVYTQICGALNGGALYLPGVMSVYRIGVNGSWTERNSDYVKFVKHKLELLKTNQELDIRLKNEYHEAFEQNELNEINRLFKHLYRNDPEVVERVIAVVYKYADGIFRFRCLRAIFYSYLYHKLGLKLVTPILRKLKIR